VVFTTDGFTKDRFTPDVSSLVNGEYVTTDILKGPIDYGYIPIVNEGDDTTDEIKSDTFTTEALQGDTRTRDGFTTDKITKDKFTTNTLQK
jgi:hypothetical protein